MNFRRTASALASLHRFYGVDVVVFCEGGSSVTVAEALLASTDGTTLDTMFWSTMVKVLRFPNRYHFKSVGNKDTLVSIAIDAQAVGATTIRVCLDSDYDHLIGGAFISNRAVYTHGYSWENDVLSEAVLIDVLTTIIGPPPEQILKRMSAAHNRLKRDLVRWCEIDISLRAKNKPSVFDRNKPLSCADLTSKPRSIRHGVLRSRLTTSCGYVRRPRRTIAVTDTTSTKVAFGKLVSGIIYHTIRFFAKQTAPAARLDYDMFMKLSIASTFKLVALGQLPDLGTHYMAQRNAF
jgi:hypothetical protein